MTIDVVRSNRASPSPSGAAGDVPPLEPVRRGELRVRGAPHGRRGRTARGFRERVHHGAVLARVPHAILREWLVDEGRIVTVDMRLKNPLLRGRTLEAGGEVTAVRPVDDEVFVDLEIWQVDDQGTQLGTAPRRWPSPRRIDDDGPRRVPARARLPGDGARPARAVGRPLRRPRSRRDRYRSAHVPGGRRAGHASSRSASSRPASARARVGTHFPYGIGWVVSWPAIDRIGALHVPFSTAYKPPELATALRHADVQLLLAPVELNGSPHADFVRQAVPDLASAPQARCGSRRCPTCVRCGSPATWPATRQAMPAAARASPTTARRGGVERDAGRPRDHDLHVRDDQRAEGRVPHARRGRAQGRAPRRAPRLDR